MPAALFGWQGCQKRIGVYVCGPCRCCATVIMISITPIIPTATILLDYYYCYYYYYCHLSTLLAQHCHNHWAPRPLPAHTLPPDTHIHRTARTYQRTYPLHTDTHIPAHIPLKRGMCINARQEFFSECSVIFEDDKKMGWAPLIQSVEGCLK